MDWFWINIFLDLDQTHFGLKFFGHGYFWTKTFFLTKTRATIITTTTTTFMGFDTIEINLV